MIKCKLYCKIKSERCHFNVRHTLDFSILKCTDNLRYKIYVSVIFLKMKNKNAFLNIDNREDINFDYNMEIIII